jgi:Na+/glutamate symporter
MKQFVTGLMIAATLTGGLLTSVAPADAQYRHRPGPYYYHHHDRGGDAAAAAALGLVGGMILGGALAQSSRPDYVYEDDYAYRPAPRRVYEEDYPRPRRGVRCRTFIKYDMYGKPYEFKDCDP